MATTTRSWHFPAAALALAGCLALCAGVATARPPAARDDPPDETVYFPSADGRTELVGYLFKPAEHTGAGPHPAVVMLHGRAGPYSSNVNAGCTLVARGQRSPCDARGLSRRHLMWGRFWSERGCVALHVDSFGPRSKAHGFGRGTHDDPARDDVNERSVRPLDAIGALRFLRGRADVAADRIGLQGWSNGGSTVLNTVADGAALRAAWGDTAPFRVAVAFYPGCGPGAVTERSYRAGVPLLVLLGDADEEVSPEVCARLLGKAAAGGNLELRRYPGASHDFDDPGRQQQLDNAAARADATAAVEKLFAQRLSP
jgi:carboxymethylenebutenolidase